ncbi:hypothetical protein NDU88_007183, partial [Pleurodeles waltl]
ELSAGDCHAPFHPRSSEQWSACVFFHPFGQELRAAVCMCIFSYLRTGTQCSGLHVHIFIPSDRSSEQQSACAYFHPFGQQLSAAVCICIFSSLRTAAQCRGLHMHPFILGAQSSGLHVLFFIP